MAGTGAILDTAADSFPIPVTPTDLKEATQHVLYHPAPEAVYQDSQQIPQLDSQAQSAELPESHSGRRPAEGNKILGLRRITFILSTLLAVAVLFDAIGGTVGGAICVKNAKRYLLFT